MREASTRFAPLSRPGRGVRPNIARGKICGDPRPIRGVDARHGTSGLRSKCVDEASRWAE